MRLGEERLDIRLCFPHHQPEWREWEIGKESETKKHKYGSRKRKREEEERGGGRYNLLSGQIADSET